MPKMSSMVLRGALVGAFLLCLLPAAAGAVQHEVLIYLDLDDDTATGCEVTTVAGVFEGAEQVLISTVETSSPPDAGTVTDVALADCDQGTNTFGVPASFDGNWPVGVGNGVGGRDVVETYAPLLSLVIQDPSVVHLGLVVTDETGGEEALLTVDGTPDGEPIVLSLQSILEIPTLGEWGLILLALLLAAASVHLMGRRGTAAVGLALLFLATGVAWAAGTLDGLIDDWSPADQLAANGLVLFGTGAPDQLCFRVDVDLLFNQPPTITDIADQTIPEDGTTGPLAFTVGDPESPANTLTVTATSSNQVLVPNGNLILGGSGANRTIEVPPEPNQNGMTDVTVTVEDPDGGTGSTTFKVTVTSDNDPPTISAIADQTIDEDTTTGPLAFTVDDVETPPGSLTVTASSDDQAIIPDGNLVLGGSGANRTITVTPAANQNGGPVTVTVLVQDGDGGSVPEQFAVTVTPVNDPPTITAIADQTIDEDTSTGPLAFTIADVDDSVGSLTVGATSSDQTLIPDGNLVIGGTAPNLTIEATPAANENGGPATITVTVTDPSAAPASETFDVTVTPVNDPPAVVNATISYAALGNTLLRVPGNDPDHDGGVPGRVGSTSDATDAFAKAGPSDIDSATVAFQMGTFNTTLGGSLTIDDDGDFHYTPPTGVTGVTDDVVVNVADTEGLTTPVTIEITLSELVWYVEDTTGVKNPAGDTDGRSTDAFETLGAAEAASGPGDYILVFETTGALDEGIALKSGQKLYGQPVEDLGTPLLPGGLVLEPIDDTDARPVIDFTSGDAVSVPATAGDLVDVEIRHLELSGSDSAIEVTSAATHAVGVTITDNRIAGSGAEGIDLNPGSSGAFTATIEDNVFATSSATGNTIDVTTAVGNAAAVEVAINGNTDITSSSGTGINLDGTLGIGTLFVTGFADNTVHGNSGGAGVMATEVTFDADPSTGAFDQVAAGTWSIGSSVNSVATSGMNLGTTAMEVEGNLSFTQLDVFAGNGTGLDVAGSGPFTGTTGFQLAVAGGTIVAAGGPAVEIDPTTAALTFASITSTGSPTMGVSLVDVEGSFTAGAGSSITGSTGNAVHLTSTLANPLDVTYGGTITNGSGRLLNVDGLPAGSDLLFNGTSLSDSGGTGIAVNDFDGVLTVTAGTTTILNSTSTGFAATGDTDGTVNLDDVAITNPAGTAVHIVDGAGQIGGTFDFDNVDLSQATNAAGLLDVQGLNDGSVNFDASSALSATDGTGVDVSSNAGTSPVTLNGPVDLGTSGDRISDGTAFNMTGNSAGTTVTAPDVDVFTSGQTAVNASGNGFLDLNALSISTVSDGRALDLDGIRSLVDVDSVTCSHNDNCVDLTNLAANSTTTFAAADLTCTGGTCFNASLARTVEVTGAANTIDATNAAAVAIVDTTIGASGVTLMSASSSGAAIGIRLDNAGTTGFFTVTGTGSTDGSGGTIQNTTQNGVFVRTTDHISLANMSFANASNDGGAGSCSATVFTGCNAAVEFETVTDVNLVNLTITGAQDHGIFGQTVTDLDISDTDITGLGADVDTNEHGIFIRDLLGTVSGTTDSVFDNVTLDDAQDTAILVQNTTATNPGDTLSPDQLTVRNSTLTDAGDSGLNVQTVAAAGNLRLVATGNTVTNTVDGIDAEASAGNLQASVGGAGPLANVISAGAGGDMVNGILFFASAAAGAATVDATATSNVVTLDAVKFGTPPVAPVSGLNGIGVSAGGASVANLGTIRATVQNNQINSSFAGVLTQTVHGVIVTNEGTGTTSQNVVAIDGNTITLNPPTGTTTAETVGIGVDGGTTGAGTTVRNTDNTIVATGDASNGASVGIQILPTESGDPAGTGTRVCVRVTGNDVSTPNNPFAASFSTTELDVIAAPVAAGSFLDVEAIPTGARTTAQLKTDLEALNTNTEVGDPGAAVSGTITGVTACPN